MYQKYKKLVMCVIVVNAITCSLSMSEQSLNNRITLEALPKVTKGFPVVIKVTVQGPQKVDYLPIDKSDIPITVYLTAKSDGKEYIIKSRRTSTGIGGYQDGRGGVMIDMTDLVFPPVEVPEGQKYTMLFDLWSLFRASGTTTSLTDLPGGQYSLSVGLDLREQQISIRGGLKSNLINIELIEPTEQEKQFIQKIRESGNVRLREGVNWVQVIERRIDIPGDGISSLTQVSKDQISFHKLLSEVNIADEQARSKSIKDVNDATLPKFFEPERQLLLLELKGNPATEREKLLQKYPQMQGMVEKLDAGGNPFLASKERSLERARLARQTATQNDPNKPTEPNKPADPNKPNR